MNRFPKYQIDLFLYNEFFNLSFIENKLIHKTFMYGIFRTASG